MNWLKNHPDVEKAFEQMRYIDSMIELYDRKHRELMPPSGTVGVGNADMDYFFKAECYRTFLTLIRNGLSPNEAGDITNEASTKAIVKWNEKGSKARASFGNAETLRFWTGRNRSDVIYLVGLMARTAAEKVS